MRTLPRSSTIECMLTQPDIHLETARHRIRPSCRPISSLSMRQRGRARPAIRLVRGPADRENQPGKTVLSGTCPTSRPLSGSFPLITCVLPAEKEGETQ